MAALLILSASACEPEPVGVDDCRAIENARCTAAVGCGINADAESCRRFYRDHCLHGLAAAESPGGPQVDACVKAIELAGACANDDPEQSLGDCLAGDDGITPIGGSELETVCDVVRYPEQTRECAFLNEGVGEGGAAGDSGD